MRQVKPSGAAVVSAVPPIPDILETLFIQELPQAAVWHSCEYDRHWCHSCRLDAMLEPISGAHFNSVVTLVFVRDRGMISARAMFDVPLAQRSDSDGRI